MTSDAIPDQLGPDVAYETVALAAAMVVQDAAAMMRHVMSLSTAALAVITEKVVETEGQQSWLDAQRQVTATVATASEVFVQVGHAAALVLSYFTPGKEPPCPTSSIPRSPTPSPSPT